MEQHVDVFGILNLTPDSFSGDGVAYDIPAAVEIANKHFAEGASYVDIGAQSTRPGAELISADEEWRRLQPVLEVLVAGNPSQFSIDTLHPETIERITETIGPVMGNNVAGMNSQQMRETVAKARIPIIISHLDSIAGTDIEWAHKNKPTKSLDKIIDDLTMRSKQLIDLGVDPTGIFLDPGRGFGKIPELDSEMLDLPKYMPEFRWMLGVSRKSSIRRSGLHGAPLPDFDSMKQDELIEWLDAKSVEVAMEGVKKGYTLLRVHNVAAHVAALKLL